MPKSFRNAAVLLVALAALAGCGGGGSGSGGSDTHTYIFKPKATATTANGPLAKGLYFTIVSPIAFPQKILDEAKKDTVFVDKAVGPQACSVMKEIHDQKAPYDVMNGKTVTIKVNGSSSFTSLLCTAFKKQAFNFGGTVGGP
jgi:hypothetical protein